MEASFTFISDRGYTWNKKNDVMIKGYFLGQDMDSVFSRLASLRDEEQISQYISSLSGCFSIIIERETQVLAFVDRVRSFPLFYCFHDGTVYFYDTLNKMIIHGEKERLNRLNEFDYSLYTYSNHTAFENIFQIPAGYYLKVDGETTELKRYWIYEYSKHQIKDEKEGINYIKKQYEDLFNDIAVLVGERTIIIPLSGGHDSRLILSSLIKCGCKKIITYSYGNPEWNDSLISKRVAEYYNVPHYFVAYTKKQKSDFDAMFEDYVNYASNFSSVPVIQEVVAINTLVQQGKIPRDAVFIPGFGGVITGHYVREDYLTGFYSGKTVSDFIMSNFFGKRIAENTDMENEIRSWINTEYNYSDSDQLSGIQANEVFEKYVFQEEQSKFIANAVRTYEFFDFQWIMPFFDTRILEAWENISNELRFSDTVFKKYEKDYYEPEAYKIGFTGSKEIKHFHKSSGESILTKYKVRFRRYFLPYRIHYLYVFITLGEYYRGILFDRNIDINHFVKKRMLKVYSELVN